MKYSLFEWEVSINNFLGQRNLFVKYRFVIGWKLNEGVELH